jgi:phosphatidylinositol glycan class K
VLFLLYSSSSLYSDDHWIIIVCTSKYWYNYRHLVNALVVYKTVKSFGITDDKIIFMNAMAKERRDIRNYYHGKIHDEYEIKEMTPDLMKDVETDYEGDDVTVDNFLKLLTGRYDHTVHHNQRLHSSRSSTIFLYMCGHGGNEFLKFNDKEELSAYDLAQAFIEMEIKHRYHQIMFIIDTCQAMTMSNHIHSKSIVSIASSLKDENSYSYYSNEKLGVAMIDRFTYALKQYFLAHTHSIIKENESKYQLRYEMRSTIEQCLMGQCSESSFLALNSHAETIYSSYTPPERSDFQLNRTVNDSDYYNEDSGLSYRLYHPGSPSQSTKSDLGNAEDFILSLDKQFLRSTPALDRSSSDVSTGFQDYFIAADDVLLSEIEY